MSLSSVSVYKHSLLDGGRHAPPFLMNSDDFSAENWIERLNRGEFDGQVSEEVRKLSSQELEKVAVLLARSKREMPHLGASQRTG